MRKYHQLTAWERTKIAMLRQSESSLTKIAVALNRSPATISREIRRNQSPPGEYWPDTAQSLALSRKKRGCLLDHDQTLKDFVITKLCCHYWSPEVIAGWLKNKQKEIRSISHESIYAWIYQQSQKKDKLWKFLARHKAKRGLRKSKGVGVSRIPNRISIHDRPKVIDAKREFGHWEGDLMSFMKNSQHILVLRERLSMFTLSAVLPNKKAQSTAQKLIGLMEELPGQSRKSLTLDNGGEFTDHHQWFNKLGLPSYFCDAYASWQKGGIENTNGRLRRDMPRRTNVQKLTTEDFDENILNYNTTPRKSLGWMTPQEVFYKNLANFALQT
jgi:IS30 family transposase